MNELFTFSPLTIIAGLSALIFAIFIFAYHNKIDNKIEQQSGYSKEQIDAEFQALKKEYNTNDISTFTIDGGPKVFLVHTTIAVATPQDKKQDTNTVSTPVEEKPILSVITIRDNGKDKKIRLGYDMNYYSAITPQKTHLICKNNDGKVIIDETNGTYAHREDMHDNMITTVINGYREWIYPFGNLMCTELELERYIANDQTNLDNKE